MKSFCISFIQTSIYIHFSSEKYTVQLMVRMPLLWLGHLLDLHNLYLHEFWPWTLHAPFILGWVCLDQTSWTALYIAVKTMIISVNSKFVQLGTEHQLIHKHWMLKNEWMLIAQDTGISVRKRVIAIFRDICLRHPTYPKVPDMCVLMIRRIGDEDGVKVSVGCLLV